MKILERFVTIFQFKTNTAELERLDRRLAASRRNMRRTGATLIGVGGALTGAGFQAGRTVLSYEAAVNRLAAVNMDSPISAMDRYRQQSQALSDQWSESATEIIGLQEELKRTGLGWQDVLTAAPTVLKLAIGNNLDFAESAKIVTQTLNAYSFGADQAIRVSDVLAKAATQLFPTDLAEMGPAIRQVAGLAESLDIPFERLIALIGVLRKAGLPAEMAGTGLRNVLIRLIEKPAGDAQEIIAKLGIEWDKVNRLVEQGDIAQALRILRSANIDASDAIAIFGAEAGNAGIKMVEGADSIAGYEQALNDAAGTTEAAAERIKEGPVGAVDALGAAFERAQIRLGEAGLTETIEEVATTVVDLIGDFENLDPEMQGLIGKAIALGPALIAVGGGLNVLAWSLKPAVLLIRALAIPAFIALGTAAVAAGRGIQTAVLAARVASVGKAAALGGIGAAAAAFAGAALLDYNRAKRTGGVGDPYLTGRPEDTVAQVLPHYFPAGHDAGSAYMDGLVGGIDSGQPKLAQAMAETAQMMRGYMPGSDAEHGPLSDLTASGKALGMTLAKGIRLSTADLQSAIVGALALPVAPPPTAPSISPGGATAREV